MIWRTRGVVGRALPALGVAAAALLMTACVATVEPSSSPAPVVTDSVAPEPSPSPVPSPSPLRPPSSPPAGNPAPD